MSYFPLRTHVHASVHRGAVQGFWVGIVLMCRSPIRRLLGLCLPCHSNLQPAHQVQPEHQDNSMLQMGNIYVQLRWMSIVYYRVFASAKTAAGQHRNLWPNFDFYPCSPDGRGRRHAVPVIAQWRSKSQFGNENHPANAFYFRICVWWSGV